MSYIGRLETLKHKLNSHLFQLTGVDKDYFGELSQLQLIQLKSVVSDINNILTLKMTMKATSWICDTFKIADTNKSAIIERINATKPNTNGYDIFIPESKVVAEVKCIVPINGLSKYGAAQSNGILDDAIKLKGGKKELRDTNDYIKFLFLMDLGTTTDKAITDMVKLSKGTSEKPLRANRHLIKKFIVLLDEDLPNYSTDKVYIKKLSIME